MSNGVVQKASRGDAGLFGQILVRRRYLIVDSIEQHWDQSAKMRDNDLDVRVSMRHLPNDYMKHHERIFQRRAHRAGQIEIVEQRRAETINHRMEAQDHT